jgi:DNA-binding response OmpR family regulator
VSVGKCLIIEDSRLVTKLICDHLTSQNYTVLCSDRLETAQSAFGRDVLSAIVLDLNLPGLSGMRAVKAARAQWPAPGLVAMTGGGNGTDATESLRLAIIAGADLSIAKPFSESKLLEVVGSAARLGGGLAGHVMVIDDSRTVRQFAVAALTKGGYRVSACATMDEALDVLAETAPDCVVTDIFMPGIGGIEGMALLRTKRPDLPIMAMSGGLAERMQSDKALAAASKVGAQATLAKPFGPDDLLAAVKPLIRGRKAAPAQ